MSQPWMPLYIADYLADTRRLSTLEHGVYLLLIMEYWRNGGLPNDEGQLARIAGLSVKEWNRARPAVYPFFHDGWKHKRIDKELAETASRSDSARRAANERWEKKRDANAYATASPAHQDGISASIAETMPITTTTTVTSLPPPEVLENREKAQKPVRKNGSFEAKCRSLVGEEPVLADPNFNSLADAVEKDGITEDDVIVGISSAMAKPDFRPRHWGQFVGWARHAAQDRLAGKPKITKSGNGSDPNETMVDIGTGPMPEANLVRMIREPNGVGVKNWIETYAGTRARFREKVEQRAPHLVKFFPVEKHVA